jgi:P27 family predicted phage terminase small subunit
MANQKSPEYRALTGAGDRKSRAKEPSMEAGIPRCPGWLSKDAKAAFKHVAAHLAQRGTVSPADGAALVLYACAYSRFVTAQKDLDKNGHRITQRVLDSHGKAVEVDKENPNLKLVMAEAKNILAYLRQFGCTPATRERVRPAKPKDDDEDGITSNDVDELIARAARAQS